MEKMSPDTFKERFGENTAIAALAVIVEDEEKDKKRLIHATHGVRVNHRIKCRDKLRALGPREETATSGSYGEEGVSFLDSGRYQEGPPPLQTPGGGAWVPGISWTPEMAHHLLGPCPIDMLLYADDLESLAIKRGRIAIVLSYCYFTAPLQVLEDLWGIQG